MVRKCDIFKQEEVSSSTHRKVCDKVSSISFNNKATLNDTCSDYEKNKTTTTKHFYCNR